MNLQPCQRFREGTAVHEPTPDAVGRSDIHEQTSLQLKDLPKAFDIAPREREGAKANR